jgi:hypothetical protein
VGIGLVTKRSATQASFHLKPVHFERILDGIPLVGYSGGAVLSGG